MDYKLLGKILVAQSILLFCIFVVLWLLNPNGIDPLFWMILVLVFSLLSYRRQTKAAKHLGITQDHPAYQQKGRETVYKISTEPYWKYAIVDGYSGYRVHEVIKVLLKS